MKNLRACALLGAFMVISCLRSFGQEDQLMRLKTVVPPSPNAAGLGKYVDWPVNLYTGVPTLDIPLYQMQSRSLQVPISLSYHAGGNKVTDIASWVGLAFSIQSGGLITRSIVGLPDDEPSGFFQTSALYNNPADLSLGTINPSDDSTVQYESARGCMDTQPDYYMFSALGRSYKLVVLSEQVIYTQPYSKLKFKVNFAQNEWQVTLEDGAKLVFGGSTPFIEVNTNARFGSCYGDNLTVVSSWYLKSVTSSQGEVINFTYTTSGVHQTVNFSEVQHVSETDINTVINNKSAHVQDISMLMPNTIESDLERVEFVKKSTVRQDLEGGYALDEIKVYSKITNQYIRSFKFDQTYSTAVASNEAAAYPSTTHNYRLKLNTVTEQSIDLAQKKVWRFAYVSQNLPSRRSYALDHWGYFNGATTNTTLLPASGSFPPPYFVSGVRDPNETYMKGEMISSVTYPTGGTSTFEFEANQYPGTTNQFTTVTDPNSLYLTYGQNPFVNQKSITFTIVGTQYAYMTFDATFSPSYRANFGANVLLASAQILDANNQVVDIISFKNDQSFSKYVQLSPGTYTFKLSSISPSSDFASTSDNVSLNGSVKYAKFTGTLPYVMAGGLRVKSIVDYDPVNNQSIKKSFVYEAPLVLSAVSIDTYQTRTIFQSGEWHLGVSCLLTNVAYQTRNSNSRFSIGDIQGGTIGYGKVTVLLGDNGVMGKTVSYFSNNSDYGMTEAQEIPYPPVTNMSWRRGLLLEKRDYTADPVLVKKEKHVYEFATYPPVKVYKTGFIRVSVGECSTFVLLNEVLRRSYYTIQVEQVKETSTTHISYATNVEDSLTAVTQYYYDNANNLKPSRIEETDSKGNTIKIYRRTPLDKTTIQSAMPLTASASLAIDSLVRKNILEDVILQEKYLGTTLLDRTLVNYKIGANNIVSPESVEYQKGTSAREIRIQNTAYDGYGNLQEQLKANDVKRSYVYDYVNNYPVAEAVNADHASIAFSSFETSSAGNWTLTGGTSNSAASHTGYKSFQLAAGNTIAKSSLVSTQSYVVSFWAQGTGLLVNGAAATAGIVRNGWTYYEKTLTGVTSISISGTGTLDDLRLLPKGCEMVTLTYEPTGAVQTTTDANNLVTYYLYDGLGRLTAIKDDQQKVMKTYRYNYKQ
jgi:YD repeat-containing protein